MLSKAEDEGRGRGDRRKQPSCTRGWGGVEGETRQVRRKRRKKGRKKREGGMKQETSKEHNSGSPLWTADMMLPQCVSGRVLVLRTETESC